MPSDVAIQLDAGMATIGSVPALLSLIRASSMDNVQGQAVLAAMTLGSSLFVSPQLYGKAINALNGNENVKVKNIRLSIGLTLGGTLSLLQGFIR